MIRNYTHYTTKEMKFITENLSLTDSELAEHLGRSEVSVSGIRRYYNIKKTHRRITPEVVNQVRELMHLADWEIGEIIGRTKNAVMMIRTKHNLPKKRGWKPDPNAKQHARLS